jgi:hypothetical protein
MLKSEFTGSLESGRNILYTMMLKTIEAIPLLLSTKPLYAHFALTATSHQTSAPYQ